MRRRWLQIRRFVGQKVLHTDDSPHTVAMGAAIATFVAFLPLVGLQTVIAVGIAALIRANKAICVPIVWITNPVTLAPIYGACIYVGRLILGTGASKVPEQLLSGPQGSLFEKTYWANLFKWLASLGTELWLGCTLVGIIGAIVAYSLARWGVVKYRERRRQRILLRQLRRAGKTIASKPAPQPTQPSPPT